MWRILLPYVQSCTFRTADAICKATEYPGKAKDRYNAPPDETTFYLQYNVQYLLPLRTGSEESSDFSRRLYDLPEKKYERHSNA